MAFKKVQFPIVPMIIVVIISSILLGKRGSERSVEEVWEPPAMVGSKDFDAEDEIMVESDAEDVIDSTEEISLWENSEPVCVLAAEEGQRLQDEALSASDKKIHIRPELREL